MFTCLDDWLVRSWSQSQVCPAQPLSREVNPVTCTEIPIYWSSPGFQEGQGLPAMFAISNIVCHCSRLKGILWHYGTELPKASRTQDSMYLPSAVCQTALQKVTRLVSIGVFTSVSSQGHGGPSTKSGLVLSGLMDTTLQCLCWTSLCCSKTDAHLCYRCTGTRLGGNHLGVLLTQALWSAQDLKLHINVRKL